MQFASNFNTLQIIYSHISTHSAPMHVVTVSNVLPMTISFRLLHKLTTLSILGADNDRQVTRGRHRNEKIPENFAKKTDIHLGELPELT